MHKYWLGVRPGLIGPGDDRTVTANTLANNMLVTTALFFLVLAVAGGAEIPRMPAFPARRSARLGDDADVCQGKQTACVDNHTLQVCADLGNGYIPVSTMQCPAEGTPYCVNGLCVAQPPTTLPPSTTPTTPWRPTPRPPTSPPDDGVCGHRVSVCADCYTQTLCARMGNQVVPVSNRACSAAAPYCVEGVCKADLPTNSTCEPVPAPVSSFRCYVDGYLPDPANCSQYHLCVGDKAYDYECPAGLVYDQQRALCVRSSDSCFQFDCRGRAGKYLLYGPDQSLYALCVTDDNHDALVASCPAGHRLQAEDPVNVSCEPYCARWGRFADVEDPKKMAYYECLPTTSKWTVDDLLGPLRGSCPPDSVFDPASERCQAIPSGRGTRPVQIITTPIDTSPTAYTEPSTERM